MTYLFTSRWSAFSFPALIIAIPLPLRGCGTGTTAENQVPPTPISGPTLQGRVMSGQQPVVGVSL